MVRAATIAILATLLCPYALAWTFANFDSALPPCCRRDGAHHCSMMKAGEAGAGQESANPALRSSGNRCPYRCALTMRFSSHAAALPTRDIFYAAVRSHPAIAIQAMLVARISESRSHLERGPPVLS